MARLIAIDLGSHAVKVTVLQGTGRDHELDAEFVQPVPQDGTLMPTLADRLASLDILLRNHSEWFAAHITEVAWSGDRATVHRMTLPFTEAAQIDQTLPFMVEAEVPFDLEEMVLGWRKADDDGGVLVTLANEDDVRALVDALGERELDPRHVILDGDALGVFAKYSDTATAIIDIGHGHTVVSVARGGTTMHTRALSVAGHTFTRVIQEALGCSWGEAEALKHGSVDEEEATTAGHLDDDTTDPAFGNLPHKAREALYGAVGLLLAEVRSTLIHAEDSLGIEIEEILLTGGGSKVSEIRGYMEQDLGLPVRGIEDDTLGPVRPELALARGLSHRMTGEVETEATDLRVGDLAFRGGLDLTRAIMVYGGAGVGFFLVAVFFMFGWRMYTYGNELAEVESRLADVVAESVGDVPGDMSSGGMVALMAEVVGEAQEEADFLGDGHALPETVDMLYQITRAFPPHPDVRVNVDSFELTQNAIKISGVTEGFSQVDSIQQKLSDAGLFREVVATPGSRNTKGRLNFTVDIDRTTDDGEDTDVPLDEDG
jgi:Tfp pilus assembly PilM family ATPase